MRLQTSKKLQVGKQCLPTFLVKFADGFDHKYQSGKDVMQRMKKAAENMSSNFYTRFVYFLFFWSYVWFLSRNFGIFKYPLADIFKKLQVLENKIYLHVQNTLNTEYLILTLSLWYPAHLKNANRSPLFLFCPNSRGIYRMGSQTSLLRRQTALC